MWSLRRLSSVRRRRPIAKPQPRLLLVNGEKGRRASISSQNALNQRANIGFGVRSPVRALQEVVVDLVARPNRGVGVGDGTIEE